MFRRKKPVFTAKNIIESFIQDPSFGKHKNQHATIIRKDGKKVINRGHLYFRDGKLYSVFIEEAKPNVYARVLTGGEVSEDDLNSALRQAGGNPNSSKILDHLATQKVLSENIIFDYKREFLMDAFTKIVSWEECEGESDVETTTEFAILPVNIKEAFKVIDVRTEQLRQFHKEVAQFFTRSDIQYITPALRQAPSSLEYETSQILALCDGTNTIKELSSKTGIPFFNIFREIYELWKNDIVSFRYNALTVTYKNVQDSIANGILDTTSDTRIKDMNKINLNPIEDLDIDFDQVIHDEVQTLEKNTNAAVSETIIEKSDTELSQSTGIDATAPIKKRKIDSEDFKNLSNLLNTLNEATGNNSSEEIIETTQDSTPHDLYDEIDFSEATNISQKIMLIQTKINEVEEESERAKTQKEIHQAREEKMFTAYNDAKQAVAQSSEELTKSDNYLEKLLVDLDSIMRGK